MSARDRALASERDPARLDRDGLPDLRRAEGHVSGRERGQAVVALVTARAWLATAAAVGLVGCGSVSRVVVLQHPDTKQTVQCRVDPWGDMRRTNQIDHCVKAYQQAGYGVVGDSDP